VDPLALGHPGWPAPTPSWDWWPLVGIVLVLLIGTRSLGLHVTVPMVAVAVGLGPCFATVVHAWGVVPAAAFTLLVRAVAVRARSTPRPGPPPNPV
jgi:hypothetical protein